MTVRLQRARPGSPELQALVDDLAERLGRSVAVDDPLVRMVCTSRHFGDEDPVRIGTLLQGRADNATIRYVLAQGVTQWSRAGFIEGRDDLGLLPRYVVPLRERGHLLGLLLVVVPEKTLAEHETRAIARAADAMAAQMHGEHIAGDTRKADERDLVLELVGTDVAARTTARRRAKELGLLGAAEHVLVTVVQLSCATELVRHSEAALWGRWKGSGRRVRPRASSRSARSGRHCSSCATAHPARTRSPHSPLASWTNSAPSWARRRTP